MKKVLLFLLLMIPFIVKAESKIYIDNIIVEENKDVDVVTPAKADGLNLNLDLKFKYYDSYIKYKLTIKNKTNEDYVLDDEINYSNGDYIKYDLTCEGDENIILSYKSKVCYLKATYNTPPSFELLKTSNRSVKSKDEVTLNLTGQEIINPKTGYKDIIGLLVILISFGVLLFVYLNNKTSSALLMLIISLLVIIPQTHALTKVTLNIDSKVEIIGNTKKCSHTPRDMREFTMCEMESILLPLLEERVYKNRNAEEEFWQTVEESAITNNINSRKEEYFEYIKTLNIPLDSKSAYNFILEYFNWDAHLDGNPNENNYRDYLDGIYANGFRIIPWYDPDDPNRLAKIYYTYRYLDGLSYSDSIPSDIYELVYDEETLKNAISEVSKESNGYSFFKFVPHFSRYRNFSVSDITAEQISQNSSIMSTFGYKDITISLPILGEVERMDYQFGLETIFTLDGSGEDAKYHFSRFASGGEYFSTRFLRGADIDEVNKIIESYDNAFRNQFLDNVYVDFDNYMKTCQSFEEMFKSLINLGYIEESYEDILNGNMSNKTREYFRWYNIPNLREYNNWLEQYNSCQNDSEKEALKDSFYNHYGVTKYVPDNVFSQFWPNYYEETVLNTPSNSFMNSIVIVYKGKFYKGKVGFFDFVNDFHNFGLVRDPNDLDSFLDQLGRNIRALWD